MPAISPPDTVAVTGASGFVGSHVVRELLKRGFNVRAILTDPTNESKTSHLRSMTGADKRLTLHKGDLMTEGSYDAAFAGAAGVVHCAAKVHEKRQGPEIVPSHLEGTRNVLASAVAAKTVRRFVQTSSEAAVFDPWAVTTDTVLTEADWSDAATQKYGGT